MFLALGLYVLRAGLIGISVFIYTLLQTREVFTFNTGLVDYILSFKAPLAQNHLILPCVGLAFVVIYYVAFRFVITKFNLKDPDIEVDDDKGVNLKQ